MSVIREERDSADYDEIFADGGHEGVFHLPYYHCCYFPLYRRALTELRRRGGRKILEVGCGTGGFAHYVMEKSSLEYRGFDFSTVAVEHATKRTKRPEKFYVGDGKKSESYVGEYDTIVCTEVLEHIEMDREVIANWRTGALCACSVPNFDSDTHVRFFQNEAEVETRYGDLIHIERIVRIKKPELSDLSLRSYVRALRWNRYRLRSLLNILGFNDFDRDGGWFLLVGTKK